MRAPFDCAIKQNATGTAQTGEGTDERCIVEGGSSLLRSGAGMHLDGDVDQVVEWREDRTARLVQYFAFLLDSRSA
jgi:hypothetical protein